MIADKPQKAQLCDEAMFDASKPSPRDDRQTTFVEIQRA
jgi:hypothetical protein